MVEEIEWLANLSLGISQIHKSIQGSVVATELLGPAKPKYVPSVPLPKIFANP